MRASRQWQAAPASATGWVARCAHGDFAGIADSQAEADALAAAGWIVTRCDSVTALAAARGICTHAAPAAQLTLMPGTGHERAA